MSRTLIKAGNTNIGKDNKRVIDSNQAVFDRISKLAEILEVKNTEQFADDFSEGLDAEQVDALLADQDEAVFDNEAYEKMIADANEEAARIVEDARAEADRIVSEANQDAEDIRKKAYDDGYGEGHDVGYNEGLASVKEIEDGLNDKIAQHEAEYEELISQLEPRFVNTLTEIYSHIFHVDMSDKTELVLYLLRDAIRGIEGGRNFLVHVAQPDYAYVNEHKDELAENLASSCTVEVVEDITLTKGNCFVEAEGGIFDCGLGTELELLNKELLLLSYSAE